MTTPLRTPHTRSAPEVLTCKSPADFLAALPRLVGFTAPDSLFVALFSGSRAQGALRVDLPDSEAPSENRAYLDEFAVCLRRAQRLHGESAPALVITSSLTFAEAAGTPWRRFAAQLTRRLAAEGQRPREFCCLAPDGWVSFYDPAPPRFGRALSEIAASPASPSERVPALADLGAFREVAAEEGAAVARALRRARARDAGHPRATAGVRSEVARLFHARPLSHAEAARILLALGSDAGWACAFDALAATASALPDPSLPRAASPAEPAYAAEPACAATEKGGAGGSALAGPALAGPALPPAAVPGRDTRPGTVGLSRGAHREALARLAAASEHLSYLAPLAPEQTRVSIMSLCALAWWTRGLESVAHRQIRQAIARDPEHEVARLTLRVMTQASSSLMAQAHSSGVGPGAGAGTAPAGYGRETGAAEPEL